MALRLAALRSTTAEGERTDAVEMGAEDVAEEEEEGVEETAEAT